MALRKAKSSVNPLRRAVELVTLERRLFMCVDGSHGTLDGHAIGTAPAPIIGDPLPTSIVSHSGTAPIPPSDNLSGDSSLSPLSAVPALNSLPGAFAKLYLDFDGDSRVHNTPAYNDDTDPTTFSDAELDAITDIWARTAEKYAAFNINVTTVDPGNLNNGETLRVLVGGTGAWSGGSYGGIAPVGAFTSPYESLGGVPNTVYTFSDNYANNDRQNIADVNAHEAGHGFGLWHQSAYDSAGKKTAEYYWAGPVKTPIMGSHYGAERSTWWRGPSSLGPDNIQDDVAILSNSTNGFGVRADDHYDLFALADPLSYDAASGSVSDAGVIERTTDRDLFHFKTAPGTVTLSANTVVGGTLDAKVNVYRQTSSGGYTLAKSASTSSLSETVTFEAYEPGTYVVSVESQGAYGDLGQYKLGGSIVPLSAPAIAAPTDLAATVGNGQIDLSWTDASNNEDGFAVQRSTDGGATWQQIGVTAAGDETFSDGGVANNKTYYYRVSAFNADADSPSSNVEGLTTPPAAPSGVTATVQDHTTVKLAWADVDGETQYKVERSIGGNDSWTLAGTTGANVTSFTDSVAPDTTYQYRVIAISSAGRSASSNLATVTTPYMAPPATPANLTLTAVTIRTATFTWDDVDNEAGYNVQTSTDGTSWTNVVTNLSPNTTSFTAYPGTPDATFYYRVRAFNSGGPSAWTAPLTVRTQPDSVPVAPVNPVISFWGDGVVINYEGPENAHTWILEQLVDVDGEPQWQEVSRSDEYELSTSGLAPNAFHQFRARAANDLGVSEPTKVLSGWTGPVANTLAVTVASGTQTNVSWTEVAGATEYSLFRYKYGGNQGYVELATFAAGETSFTDAVEGSSRYSYYVVSRNSHGAQSGYSNFVEVTTSGVLQPPTNLKAVSSRTNYQVDLAWQDVTGETGYKVQRSTDGGATWSQIGTRSANVLTFTDYSVTPGNTYRYRVLSTSAGGDSAPSAVASASVMAMVVPDAPINLRQTAGEPGSVTIAWDDESDNETEFVIERYHYDPQWREYYWMEVGRTTGAFFTDDGSYDQGGISPGTYQVYAENGAGASAMSNTVDARPAPSDITLYTATSPSPTQVKLEWWDNGASDNWLVQRSPTGANGSWVTVASLGENTTSYTDSGLSIGTTYHYRVVGGNEWGQSASPAKSVTTLSTPLPAAPTNLAIAGYDRTDGAYYGVDLQWVDNATNEAGFVLERSTLNSGTWAQVGQLAANTTEYTDAQAAYGTRYSYRLRAYNVGGSSANGNVVSSVIPAPLAVSGVTATSSSPTQVTVAWADVVSETGYRVQRSTDGVNWSTPGSVAKNVTTFADAAAVGGTAYTYRVFATNTGGDSPVGTSASVTTVAVAPATLTATANGATAINLSWTNVAGETAYKVERSLSATGGWAEIGTTAANVTTFASTGLAATTTYHYRVRATNASGNSAYSPTASATTANAVPAAPSSLVITSSTRTSVAVAWTDNANNETGFRIERSLDGSTWTQVGTVGANVTAYNATGLTRNRTYYFRVRAYNALGNSAYSNVATGATQANGTMIASSPSPATSDSPVVTAKTRKSIDWMFGDAAILG